MDRYLSDDDEDYWRPPPIPSGQINQGANARLPPEVQQLPDPRARAMPQPYRIVSDDGSVNIYVDRFGQHIDMNQANRRRDRNPPVPRLPTNEPLHPNIKMVRHGRERTVMRWDDNSNQYIIEPSSWSTSTSESDIGMKDIPHPNIRVNRHGKARTIYRWDDNSNRYILEPSSWSTTTSGSELEMEDTPHPNIRVNRHGKARTIYRWDDNSNRYILEPSSWSTTTSGSELEESGMITKDGRIVRP